MLAHILVPLDGSRSAEAALPVAAKLAALLRARLTLIHVLEKAAPEAVHGESHLRTVPEAEAYLRQLRAGYGNQEGWECHVHSPGAEDVAGGIIAHEEELRPDLIVMCTHGPADLERVLRGSLAQRVVALGRTPLLLVRPGKGACRVDLTRLLVPLDGTARHEGGFAAALELGAAAGSRLELLGVIPTSSVLAGPAATLARFLPGTSQTMETMAAANLDAYLRRTGERAAALGLAAGVELRSGDVAAEIVRAAEAHDAGLIILGTHGKAGTRAFWANSVAARVQARTCRLLLLVPAGEEAG